MHECSIRAILHLADMYTRQSMWDEANTTYNTVIDRHGIRTALGWEARLAVGRLVVFKCNDIKDARVHDWLRDMVDQKDLSPVRRIEPYEMLGMAKVIYAVCNTLTQGIHRCMLRICPRWRGCLRSDQRYHVVLIGRQDRNPHSGLDPGACTIPSCCHCHGTSSVLGRIAALA